MSFPIFFDLLGNLLNWYDMGKLFNLFYFDDFVHFLFPLILFFGINILYKNSKAKVVNILLTSSITLGLVTIWEIYEYWSDIFFKTTMVSGLEDTMTDITFGFVAILVGVGLWKILSKERSVKNT